MFSVLSLEFLPFHIRLIFSILKFVCSNVIKSFSLPLFGIIHRRSLPTFRIYICMCAVFEFFCGLFLNLIHWSISCDIVSASIKLTLYFWLHFSVMGREGTVISHIHFPSIGAPALADGTSLPEYEISSFPSVTHIFHHPFWNHLLLCATFMLIIPISVVWFED